MKASYIFTIILISLLVTGCASNTQTSAPPTTTSEELIVSEQNPNASETRGQSEGTRYVIFSDGVLDKVTTEKRVLFFYASWCPTCRPIDVELNQKAGELPEDLTIIRVNYNDPDTDEREKELAKKYNVTYQHTFVQIDQDGNEVTKWNGGNVEQILSKTK